MNHIDRRQFVRLSGGIAAAAALGLHRAGGQEPRTGGSVCHVPVRPITKGPTFHWFAYYDKLQFDPTGRYALAMETDFEGRSPRADDTIRIGMIDLQDGDRWIEIGASRAWGWQQGCMLQWIPGSASEVIWNDREGDRFVARIHDVTSGRQRMIPHPVYTLSPDGKTAVSPDFARLNSVRPGYGYAGLPDPNENAMAPADTGIFRVDLASGKQDLILPLADVVGFQPKNDATNFKHWFNHLLFNTDGSRFTFLHRCRAKGAPGMGGFITRMLTADRDGKNPFIIDPSGNMSHFIWRDPDSLLGWTKPEGREWGFWLLKDRTAAGEQIGKSVLTENGHCSYLPGNKWILNDTYPGKTERLQKLHAFHVATGRRVPLADLHSPPEYAGEWRCDLHPRFSPDGKWATVDSTHEGKGRQIYLVDMRQAIA